MLIDGHCHLDNEKFDEDREEVISRAKKAGIGLIINQGLNPKSNKATLALAKKHKFIKPTLGVHPVYLNELSDAEVDREIENIRKNKEKIAIGEVGLDYMWIKKILPEKIGIEGAEKEKERQIKYFRKFIELAKEQNLPLITHSRWAIKRLCDMLKELKPKKVVLHGFDSSIKEVMEMIKLGYYITISTNILYSEQAEEFAKQIPLKSILTETDAPYLFRKNGKWARNEPANIKLLVKKLAEIKGLKEEVVEKQIENNFKMIFGIK